MSSKISQLDPLLQLSGDEDVLIVSGTSNWRVKISRIVSAINKASLGLDQVDNTSDAMKPVSNPTQLALNQKANVSHTHAMGDINGLANALSDINSNISSLSDALAQKANVGHTHAMTNIVGLVDALSAKADAVHQHAIADVSGLQNTLNSINQTLTNKAEAMHTHALSDITGLVQALAGKANTVHQHVVADITDFAEGVSSMIQGMIVSGNHQW